MDYTAQLIDLVDKPSWKMLLTEIVEKEHLDPWDIDIAQLTHSYIEHINSARKLDFRVPANAVLVSAILLRFKSDAWELYPQAAVEEQLENQSEWEFILEGKRVPELNPSRRITRRKVTIEELIRAIDDVIEKEKRRAEKRAVEHFVPEKLISIAFDTTENFQDLIDRTYDSVISSLDSQKLAMFSDLVKGKPKEDVIYALISLLHLATKRKLVVWQDEAFKEIFITLPEGEHAGT
jgi:segregation and condensation protein A